MNSNWPEPYSCKFLEAGIVSYEDSDAGIALIKKETIDAMAETFVGKPVCINHQKITPENYHQLRRDGLIVGNVMKVWFNPTDGWFYADFFVDTEESRRLIDERKFSVSCAYDVIDVKEGGLWHDIKFDGEITSGSFTHLALVDSPRYEESKITKQLPAMLVNGKAAHFINNQEDTDMSIFKFKKTEQKKEEDIGLMHMNMEGKAVPVTDVLLACVNSKKLDLTTYQPFNDKQMYQAQDTDIVDINGKTVSIGELKASYGMKTENEKKNCSCGAANGDEHKKDCTFFNKKNEKTEEEKKNEKEEEEKKAKEAQNAKEEEEKKKAEEAKNAKEEEEKKAKEEENKNNEKEKEEKENAKKKTEEFFNELKSASQTFVQEEGSPVVPKTREERAKEWAAKTNKKK